MRALCISAIASNQGKTILTTALLHYFKNNVRAFKIGPDYIDPQFHAKVSKNPSINLDTYMMNKKQVKWLFNHYSDQKISICEGVMGFYDGLNKGCSAYDVTKLLKIPTVLILDGAGSYITVSAVLKGLKSYKKNNTIKAVVLNNLSSQSHYELIKKQIEKDFDDISVCGWIEKNLESLKGTHLGLDLDDINKLEFITIEVLKHIDIDLIKKISKIKKQKNKKYPFKKIERNDKKLAIVYDSNFSFLYWDNYIFLKQIFKSIVLVDSTKDEVIPQDCNSVYICGGYVETTKAYDKIKNSNSFKSSLIQHSLNKDKKIYAECAGLLYLGKEVQNKPMSGILDVEFILQERFARLGYYINEQNIKGHSFHYTVPVDYSKGFDILSKTKNGNGKVGSWSNESKNVFGTYLHTMFRNNTALVKKYLI